MDGSAGARALLVLGMHRSGTSALAGVLRHLGVELGSALLGPQPGNAAGLWEHAEVLDLHERLLAALDQAWDAVEPLPEDWLARREIEPFRDELRALIRREFGGAGLWGVKDPRLCRLAPLWLEVLAGLDQRPLFAVIVRDPEEVVQSLATRNGFPPQKGLLLWLLHVLEALRHSRGHPRALLTFEALLADWRVTVERMLATLGPIVTLDCDAAAAEIEAFLSPQLRHHVAAADIGEPPSSDLFAAARRLYRAIAADEAVDHLADETYRSLYAVLSQVAPLLASQRRRSRADTEQIAALSEQVTQSLGHVDKLKTHVASLRAHIQTLEDHIAKFGEVEDGYRLTCQHLGERDAEVAALRTELAERDAELATLRSKAARGLMPRLRNIVK